jgi:hypothetical protein
MKFKLTYIIALVFAISIFNTSAQSSKKQSLKTVNYKDNVNMPLTSQERAFIEEVYADKFDAYVINRPQKLKDIKNLLRNRVAIEEMPELVGHTKKYKSLSEMGLFNSYNTALTFDKAYNKGDFNVLKYNLNFYSRGTKMYRIDNTNYFIIVKSQHH